MSPEVIAIIISAASVGLALFAGLAGMFAWFFKFFKSELGEVKTSMKDLDGSLRGEMKSLDESLRAEMALLRDDNKDIKEELVALTVSVARLEGPRGQQFMIAGH